MCAAQARQPLVLAGRVLRIAGADTVPLARHLVVAHRVSMTVQGAIDSQRTDARGAFRFRVTVPESLAVYVASTRYAGIGYFAEPFSGAEPAGADSIMLAVYDTASTGAPLHVTIRHLVIERRAEGGRRVLDMIQVNNPGTTTRVGADTLATVWSVRLPSGITNPAVGQGEVPGSAIRFDDGRADIAAAFPPGQKQIVLMYDLPDRERVLTIAVDQPTGRLEVLVEGDARAGAGLRGGEPVTLEGRTFSHFTAAAMNPGASAQIRFAAREGGSGGAVWIVVIAAGLALAAGLAVWSGRRGERAPGAPAGATPADASDESLQAILELDARYEGREAGTDAAEWAEYLRRRGALKAELAARVARG